MHPLTARRLTESDLDAAIAWKLTQLEPTEAASACSEIGAEPCSEVDASVQMLGWVMVGALLAIVVGALWAFFS